MRGTRRGRIQRQRLLDVIRNDPGINVRRLARIAGTGWTNCEHHLRRLEEQGLVRRRRIQGHWGMFATATVGAPHAEGVGLLRDERNWRIVEAVRRAPGCRQVDLAAQVYISPSSLCRRLQALDENGLIRRTGGHHDMRLFPTAELEEAQGHLHVDTLFESGVI